jgi:hypothetical protein
MIKKTILLFLILPFLFSCYHENKVEVKKPGHFLEREEMVEILTDIQIAEGIISHNRSQRKKTNTEFKDSLYQRLFDQYHISAETLKENIAYYNVDPSVMERIYEDVLANLSKVQSEILMDTIAQKEISTDTLTE